MSFNAWLDDPGLAQASRIVERDGIPELVDYPAIYRFAGHAALSVVSGYIGYRTLGQPYIHIGTLDTFEKATGNFLLLFSALESLSALRSLREVYKT